MTKEQTAAEIIHYLVVTASEYVHAYNKLPFTDEELHKTANGVLIVGMKDVAEKHGMSFEQLKEIFIPWLKEHSTSAKVVLMKKNN